MRVALAVVLICYAGFVGWLVNGLEAAGQQISIAQKSLAIKPPTPAAIVRFDGVKKGLVLPAWSWLGINSPWAYVSAASPVDLSFEPELAQISSPTGDWLTDQRLHPEAEAALVELFSAARAANQPLIVTSAHRSVQSQVELYESSALNYGQAWANSHVARPGNSEHQIGLAVDLSSYTPACKQSFSNCHLQQETATWLASSAPDYGFILRYPPDKSTITGVAHEPWHFRYVGPRMAELVQQSGLTFDEISQKLLRTRAESTEQTLRF